MNLQEFSSQSILKEGTKHLSEKDEVVLKNIDAVMKVANITRTSMGPSGLNKLIINYLGKLFVSHDSATIVDQLEVVHPAARIVVLAAKSQEQETGDGTNFVISYTAELLRNAKDLIMIGLHTSDIIAGYERAVKKAIEIIENEKKLVVKRVEDVRKVDEVKAAMRGSVGAKLYSYVDTMIDLVSKACSITCPKNPKQFHVDSVRVLKITGGYIKDSLVVPGFVVKSDVKGSIKHVDNAKIAIYSVSVDMANTETSSNYVIRNAKELMGMAEGEEQEMEKEIKHIRATGVNVIVTKGGFGDLAKHYMEKYGIMAIKMGSKFDCQRLSKAVGAVEMTSLHTPNLEEIGRCSSVDVKEISGTKTIIFKQLSDDDTKLATIILRGATENILDEMEKGVDDGVNVYKTLTRDPRLVAGAGAFEIQMSAMMESFAEEVKGLDQYSIRKFAESFLVIPKTLVECSGYNATSVITNLRASHKEGKTTMGVNLDGEKGIDAVKLGIFDCLETKIWALKLSTQAAVAILSVDQIIMARPSGGPAPRQNPDWDKD